MTVSAPPEMVSPDPVMSVMWASDPIWMLARSKVVVAFNRESKAFVNPVPVSEVPTTKVSMSDEVAFKEPSTRRVEIVEEAVTKIPFVVEVGRRAFVKANSHAPGVPTAELEMVIDPAPFWIEIPVPEVSVAATGAAPVDPIRS